MSNMDPASCACPVSSMRKIASVWYRMRLASPPRSLAWLAKSYVVRTLPSMARRMGSSNASTPACPPTRSKTFSAKPSAADTAAPDTTASRAAVRLDTLARSSMTPSNFTMRRWSAGAIDVMLCSSRATKGSFRRSTLRKVWDPTAWLAASSRAARGPRVTTPSSTVVTHWGASAGSLAAVMILSTASRRVMPLATSSMARWEPVSPGMSGGSMRAAASSPSSSMVSAMDFSEWSSSSLTPSCPATACTAEFVEAFRRAWVAASAPPALRAACSALLTVTLPSTTCSAMRSMRTSKPVAKPARMSGSRCSSAGMLASASLLSPASASVPAISDSCPSISFNTRAPVRVMSTDFFPDAKARMARRAEAFTPTNFSNMGPSRVTVSSTSPRAAAAKPRSVFWNVPSASVMSFGLMAPYAARISGGNSSDTYSSSSSSMAALLARAAFCAASLPASASAALSRPLPTAAPSWDVTASAAALPALAAFSPASAAASFAS